MMGRNGSEVNVTEFVADRSASLLKESRHARAVTDAQSWNFSGEDKFLKNLLTWNSCPDNLGNITEKAKTHVREATSENGPNEKCIRYTPYTRVYPCATTGRVFLSLY